MGEWAANTQIITWRCSFCALSTRITYYSSYIDMFQGVKKLFGIHTSNSVSGVIILPEGDNPVIVYISTNKLQVVSLSGHSVPQHPLLTATNSLSDNLHCISCSHDYNHVVLVDEHGYYILVRQHDVWTLSSSSKMCPGDVPLYVLLTPQNEVLELTIKVIYDR